MFKKIHYANTSGSENIIGIINNLKNLHNGMPNNDRLMRINALLLNVTLEKLKFIAQNQDATADILNILLDKFKDIKVKNKLDKEMLKIIAGNKNADAKIFDRLLKDYDGMIDTQALNFIVKSKKATREILIKLLNEKYRGRVSEKIISEIKRKLKSKISKTEALDNLIIN